MIKSYRFSWLKWGKKLLVLWAIHWNETCGTNAIFNIMDQIKNNQLIIDSWEVVFVPICNPLAYKKNTRFIDKNLNRVFKYHDNPISYEKKLANELIKLVDNSDYVLDIHSFVAGDHPFVFQDYVGKCRRSFAESLGMQYVCVGWPEVFEKQWFNGVSATETYAYNSGKIAITVECGSHDDMKSVEVAQSCILRSLSYLGIWWNFKKSDMTTKFIKINKVFRRKEWELLEKKWKHLDRVKKGDKLIRYIDGSSFCSDKDCFILLPKFNATIWEEWFYLWEIDE